MSKVDLISNYRIALHTKIYDQYIINDIMCNIIEFFTREHIGIMCDNIEENIIGFSVNTTDQDLIKELVYKAYYNFYSSIPTYTSEWELPLGISIDELYNLTILNNIDRSNVLLVL
jgi:hypothetical protein